MALGHPFPELFLIVVREFEPQAFKYSVCDPILKEQDVAAFGVNTVAPEDLTGEDIEELRGNADPVTAPEKTR
jgi:hypothetical protein